MKIRIVNEIWESLTVIADNSIGYNKQKQLLNNIKKTYGNLAPGFRQEQNCINVS